MAPRISRSRIARGSGARPSGWWCSAAAGRCRPDRGRAGRGAGRPTVIAVARGGDKARGRAAGAGAPHLIDKRTPPTLKAAIKGARRCGPRLLTPLAGRPSTAARFCGPHGPRGRIPVDRLRQRGGVRIPPANLHAGQEPVGEWGSTGAATSTFAPGRLAASLFRPELAALRDGAAITPYQRDPIPPSPRSGGIVTGNLLRQQAKAPGKVVRRQC